MNLFQGTAAAAAVALDGQHTRIELGSRASVILAGLGSFKMEINLYWLVLKNSAVQSACARSSRQSWVAWPGFGLFLGFHIFVLFL